MRYNDSRAYSYSSIGEGGQMQETTSGCCGRSARVPDESQKGCCYRCMGRMPFATLIATLMCATGVAVFLFSTFKGLNTTMKMLENVFSYRMLGNTQIRLQDIKIGFIAVGAGMGVLAMLILLIGCLSTGSTRTSVYKDWKACAGGFTCLFLITVTYILKLIWIFLFGAMSISSFVLYLWGGMCERAERLKHDQPNSCVDLSQFDFLLPEVSHKNLRICEGPLKEFCLDFVKEASLYYYFATGASVIVLISLIHFLMCIAANYTRIKDQAKIADLEMLRSLEDNEMGPLGAKGNANRY